MFVTENKKIIVDLSKAYVHVYCVDGDFSSYNYRFAEKYGKYILAKDASKSN